MQSDLIHYSEMWVLPYQLLQQGGSCHFSVLQGFVNFHCIINTCLMSVLQVDNALSLVELGIDSGVKVFNGVL